MAFTDSDNDWGDWPTPPPMNEEEEKIIREAKKRFKICEDWEAQARVLFEYDYRFANGDTHNKYQWDADLVNSRTLQDKPCLTINKTQIHNLMVINDAKQNKPGVRIRPVGEEASFEGAQIFQELVYHIEYISNAESVYDSAYTWQVQAGIGYWRIITDYIDDNSFDQEVYIRRVKDPRSVYLDPNINEQDGSDAQFGFIFEDMAKDLFAAKHPEWVSIANTTVMGNTGIDGWITKDNVRICEYYRKTQKKDKLVTWITEEGQVSSRVSKLEDIQKEQYKELKKNKLAQEQHQFKERKVVVDDIQWFKIAGDRIIDKGEWLGKYVPIVRLVGIETVIDGILDRKGHTRALINAQQMYNYNTSANIEYGALQTKSPWLAPTEAIEGHEQYYKTANTMNYSYLPYNHMGEDGKPIPAPSRPAAPQSSPAYVEQLKIAQNEMMMATGQYQSQIGENENAKSGVAINARQRQGDKATYHFIDNQAIAIRFTGKILIDLVPKIYDTKRVMQISATDGSIIDLTVDPNAEQGFQKIDNPNKAPKVVNGQQVKEIIFNPSFGIYDIQSDTGPSFATKRMEAANALTQIAAADKDFLKIGGDIYFSMLDFPKANILADRYKKLLPPGITDEKLDPEIEQAMQQAADTIEQLKALTAKQEQELADRDRELTLKGQELDLKHKQAQATEARGDYDAETKRLVALGNAGPGISVEQIQPIIKQLILGMMQNGELTFDDLPGVGEGGTPVELPTDAEGTETPVEPSEGQGEPLQEQESLEGQGEPPIEGAELAPDGQWYVKQENGYARVEV